VYVNVPEISRLRRRRKPRILQAIIWAGRLIILGLLVAVLAFIAVTTEHSILKRLARAGQPQTISVTLTPTTLDPAVILLLGPEPVRFIVHNAGDAPQRFNVQGPSVAARTDELGPGAEATLEVTFAHPGTYILSAGTTGVDAPTGTLTVRP
jgi:uncharacterized cupredoxin-like copper-binding protein